MLSHVNIFDTQKHTKIYEIRIDDIKTIQRVSYSHPQYTSLPAFISWMNGCINFCAVSSGPWVGCWMLKIWLIRLIRLIWLIWLSNWISLWNQIDLLSSSAHRLEYHQHSLPKHDAIAFCFIFCTAMYNTLPKITCPQVQGTVPS